MSIEIRQREESMTTQLHPDSDRPFDGQREANEEKKDRAEALSQIYRMLLNLARDRDCREFEWTERPVRWAKDDQARHGWTCDLPPNRAMVTPTKDLLFWEVCIERPAPDKGGYNRFVKLADAVAWAEEQLTLIEMEGGEAEPELERTLAPAARPPTIDLAPYRIDPSELESERITYRVVVELESAPERFKTMELPCNRQLQYDERYLPAHRLAAELRIDESQCELEQPFGPNNSWNVGRSTATYYRESIAVEQAQLMWNNSRIVEHYRRGKLLRARYGVEEVETGYVSWLGGCECPEMPWSKASTRAEYLAEKAEELTLAHALDVEGFRDFAGLSQNAISDEELLIQLHYRRANSAAIPAAAREESILWLKEDGDLTYHRLGGKPTTRRRK